MLGLPDDYRIGIVPGSDTGAFEMAMWSLLGARGVDVLAWESFGQGWLIDARDRAALSTTCAPSRPTTGRCPDLSGVAWDRDLVFTWNGTTSGVRVPDGDWIAADRSGLSLCDATSAAFAMALPWAKLDVATYSWQKVLGGEAQHGMLILSPRAVERLERFAPPRPLPKLFRLDRGRRVDEAVFRGETINTPSMLAVEDALDGLRWAERIGGLPALIARSETQPPHRRRMGRAHAVGRLPRRAAGVSLAHIDLPEAGRSRGHGAATRRASRSGQEPGRPARGRSRGL